MWEANAFSGLTGLKSRKGDFAAARDLAGQRYHLFLKFHGPERGTTGAERVNWAGFTARAGDVDGALAMLREAMPVVRNGFPAGSLRTLNALNSAAQILNMAGRFAEAESYAREALALEDKNHLAEGDGRRASSLWQLAWSLRDRHKAQEAIPLLERALGIYEHDLKQAANADKVRGELAKLGISTARAPGGR